MAADGGLAFWLSYLESRGGLWERSGDVALAVIPEQLQRRFELPEELAVTERADVSREDGATLLGPGHPLLIAAAEDVLSAADAGVLQLPAPAAQPPHDARLLERARERFPVDHGRVDAAGPAERGLRQVIRIGAMVTYTASADDRFHERAECWADVPSRLPLPDHAVERLRRSADEGPLPVATADLASVPPALAAAHRLLDLAAAARCGVLAGGAVRVAADTERARAEKYYGDALASLARRLANAAEDRRALLSARMDSLRAEEKRRLAEIEEKYTPQYEIRPYRLHLVHVPVLRLPVDVLRGARRFPMTLEWLLPGGCFAPVRCPACGADAAEWPLAVAKTHLGCARCSARAASPPPQAAPAPAASSPAAGSTPVPDPGPAARAQAAGAASRLAAAEAARGVERASRPASRPAPPEAPAPGRATDPQALSRVGDKVALEFWSVASQGTLRSLRRMCAPDSPAAAAIRLHGASGPALAIGMPPGERPERLTSSTSAPDDGGLAATRGFLEAAREGYNYLLRWAPGTRLVAEVLPFGTWASSRLPSPRWLFTSAAGRMFEGLPEPGSDLDPVAIRLWRKVPPTHGLPLALRCLAAWWRIGEGPEFPGSHRPSVLAAAIHRMVGYRSGEAGVTHDAIAALHRVTAAETRAVTPLLQAVLQLSPTRPW